MIQILLLTFLILPLAFQIVFGFRIIKLNTDLDFWQICVISSLLWIACTCLNVWLMGKLLAQTDIRCGTSQMMGVAAFEILVAVAVVILMVVQLIRNKIKSKKYK